jgi:E3 SUMO-protein ligase PIAS1
LRNTPKSTEQVTIDPSGEWSLASKSETEKKRKSFHPSSSDDDDDDDIIEIPDIRIKTLKNEVGLARPTSLSSTPLPLSRQSSYSITTPRQPSSSNKRPISEVIDLISDDDDDEPIRPAAKRHANYDTPTNMQRQVYRPSNGGSANYGTSDTYGGWAPGS